MSEILLTKAPDDIFYSPSGEGIHLGVPKVFIRTQICPYRCTYCFGAHNKKDIPYLRLKGGTLIRLDKVQKGDVVLTFDDNQNIVETTVEETGNRIVDEYVNVKINGKFYHVTPEHPFFTETEGQTQAKDLKVGDQIVSAGMDVHFVEEISDYTANESLEVYNLQCAPYNTYLIDDMWVHNCDSMSTWHKTDGVVRSFEYILEKVIALGNGHFKPESKVQFELTGGEAIVQADKVMNLINYLKSNWPNAHFTLQTSGGIYTKKAQALFDMIDHISFDYKDLYQDIPFKVPLEAVRETDEIKMLICDDKTYEFTRDFIRENPIKGRYVITAITDYKRPEVLVQEHVDNLRHWIEKALSDPLFDTTNVQFFPRFHSILWLTKKGV